MTFSDPSDIRLLCLDVDGVLTDGSIHIDLHGNESKRFNVKDGAGISLWQRLGYSVALITGRTSMSVRHRANELGIEAIFQGCRDKVEAFAIALEGFGLNPEQAAFMGDDLPDLDVMQRCGYPISVMDGAKEIRDLSAFVTVRPGGHGAVREAIEHLLKARDQWDRAVELYDGGQ